MRHSSVAALCFGLLAHGCMQPDSSFSPAGDGSPKTSLEDESSSSDGSPSERPSDQPTRMRGTLFEVGSSSKPRSRPQDDAHGANATPAVDPNGSATDARPIGTPRPSSAQIDTISPDAAAKPPERVPAIEPAEGLDANESGERSEPPLVDILPAGDENEIAPSPRPSDEVGAKPHGFRLESSRPSIGATSELRLRSRATIDDLRRRVASIHRSTLAQDEEKRLSLLEGLIDAADEAHRSRDFSQAEKIAEKAGVLLDDLA